MRELMTKVRRTIFAIYLYLSPKKATEWLNLQLEDARIADEEERADG